MNGSPRRHWRQCPYRSPNNCSTAAGSLAPEASGRLATLPSRPFPRHRALSNRPRRRSADLLLDLSKAGGALADRIVTTSPDVTVSTNLGAWVNQRGLFQTKRNARHIC